MAWNGAFTISEECPYHYTDAMTGLGQWCYTDSPELRICHLATLMWPVYAFCLPSGPLCLFPCKVQPKALDPVFSHRIHCATVSESLEPSFLVSLILTLNHTQPGSSQVPLGNCDLEIKDFLSWEVCFWGKQKCYLKKKKKNRAPRWLSR